MPSSGAHSEFRPDLACLLSHRDIHDICEADPRNEEGESPYDTEEDLYPEADLLLYLGHPDHIPDREGPFVLGIEAVLPAEDLVDPLLHDWGDRKSVVEGKCDGLQSR